MDGVCVLICEENYENTTGKTSGEFTCTPKGCVNRKAWVNGSCSVKEDFGTGGENKGCYLWRRGGGDIDDNDDNGDGDDVNGIGRDICVEEEGCPSGYPGVYY
jgi:hypothetical protein